MIGGQLYDGGYGNKQSYCIIIIIALQYIKTSGNKISIYNDIIE